MRKRTISVSTFMKLGALLQIYSKKPTVQSAEIATVSSALGRHTVGRLCRLEGSAVGFPDLKQLRTRRVRRFHRFPQSPEGVGLALFQKKGEDNASDSGQLDRLKPRVVYWLTISK